MLTDVVAWSKHAAVMKHTRNQWNPEVNAKTLNSDLKRFETEYHTSSKNTQWLATESFFNAGLMSELSDGHHNFKKAERFLIN